MFIILFTDYRKILLPLAVVAALFWHGTRESPRPTPYPPSFRIRFDTNISRNESDATSEPLHAMLYYDWTIPAQRIDHPAGAYECIRFYNRTDGCQLYFLKNGMYRVVSTELGQAKPSTKGKTQPCCLDIAGLGPPPPDWSRQANPSFRGLKRDAYSGYSSYEFVFDKPPSRGMNLPISGTKIASPIHRSKKRGDIYDEYHTAREVHDGNPLRNGIPLTFTFPSKANGLQDYHFDPVSLVIGHQDPSFFRLPEGCENVVCEQSIDSTE